jgi:hypothetical protein
MVKINVDEAYAFDYYCILDLKLKSGFIPKETINRIKADLIEQMGEELVEEIINSNEYKELFEANELTFKAVDKAKTDDVLASYVDKCNYQRMICKTNLQTKYFNNKLTEVKIGYEKLNKNG